MSKYCIQCGTQLVEQAKFCYQCGQKVFDNKELQSVLENVEDDINNTGALVVEDVEMENSVKKIKGDLISIKLLGNNIEISQEYSNLKVVRDYFYEYAVKNVNKLKDYVEANVHCCDDIYERAIPFSINCINAAYENAVEIANKLGITYIDYECIVLSIDEQNDYNSYFAYYYEMAQAIEECAKRLSSYRESQRIKTSQWRGGGFGIGNAIKGHLKATAMNIGTNIIREISNSITDSQDRKKIQKVKEVVYRDVNMRENLYLITYNCSFLPFYILLPEFEKRGIVQIPFMDENTILRAKEAFELYLTNVENQQNSIQILKEVIQEQPLNALFYVYMELIMPETANEIADAINLLGVEFEYKIEKKGLKSIMLEEASSVADETISSIQKKLNILTILEKVKYRKKDEIGALKFKLKKEWGSIIKLMPEYELNELEEKIAAYQIFKEEYKDESQFFKEYQEDINRLQIKYEDKKMLPCLEMTLSEVRDLMDSVENILVNHNFEQLWIQADQQNGYVQALLFNFYIDKIGTWKGKVNNVEDILNRFSMLNRKMVEENSFAKFIYAAMKEKIYLRNSKPSEKENDKYIHIEYLYELNKAVMEGIVYAEYCIAEEILFKERWNNYEHYQRYDKKLPSIKGEEAYRFLKKAANALIPKAISNLGFQDKKKKEKMEMIRQELRLLEMLEIMESSYECPIVDKEKEMLVCKNCGSTVKVGKKFCSQCGTKIM